jgi:hypothetical protein
MKQQIAVAETYSVEYPFVRETVELFDYDGPTKTETWRPGVRHEPDGFDGAISVADAHGEMLLTVESIHRPGRFPERIFYTRQWKDPDGKLFGKGSLRITTTVAFRRMLAGYRHDYEKPNAEVTGRASAACEGPR